MPSRGRNMSSVLRGASPVLQEQNSPKAVCELPFIQSHSRINEGLFTGCTVLGGAPAGSVPH